MATETEETRPAAHKRIFRLVYAVLLVIGIVYVWLLAVAASEDRGESWLWRVMHGEILLWMMVVVVLGDILLLVLAKLTNKRWLRWSSVAIAIALTATYCLTVYILWLNRNRHLVYL